jgi:hypothetical protein
MKNSRFANSYEYDKSEREDRRVDSFMRWLGRTNPEKKKRT